MKFEERYQQLNDAQKEAVEAIDGPVMVLAGPGTGKTELLSMRVANILRKTDTNPENILCLTYTDNGADAMRRRLISIIGQDAYKVAVHTFHSFGTDIINQHRDIFYNGATFQAADTIATYEILRGIFEELPLNDPLASMMNGEYTAQRDASKAISELKRAGLTDEEFRAILDANDVAIERVERVLAPIISARVSKKMIPELETAITELRAFPTEPTLYGVPDLMTVTLDTLEQAIAENKISAWKSRFFKKDDKNEQVLKARHQQQKLRSLTRIYNRYLDAMQMANLYDYDDMILQVVHALEINDDLRFNLQEKYQYLLVDEFQDTNLAQLRILHSLTNNSVNEDRPNIFIVGDDDQAIYSFQGADINNILNFQTIYPATQRIVLTDNYRSTQSILNAARAIIKQGGDRLEQRDPSLNKQLATHTTDAGHVSFTELEGAAQERQWVAQQVAALIKKGETPADIAVLLHHHDDIQALLPHFAKANIPVHYERRDNIFELPPIIALELLGRTIAMLAENRHDIANELLPRVLAHPAFGFKAQDIWNLSTKAYDNHARWIDEMEKHPPFAAFREWLITLVVDSLSTPLEVMIDKLLGVPDDQSEAGALYTYFFSKEKLDTDPAGYLVCLDALRLLRERLISYHPNEPLTLPSFMSFIDLHQRIGDRIQLTHNIGESDTAVNIMTAHSAKGLEFEHVFVVGVTDSEWGLKARGRSSSISYPENLALAPQDQTYDERLRLFYVAMTRAKRQLFISYALRNDANKAQLPASFLVDDQTMAEHIDMTQTIADLTDLARTEWYQPLLTPQDDLITLLKPRLDHYRLSATHLNSFVDVTRGGPNQFLVSRILHFPSITSPNACYGLAIHATLQQAHSHFNSTGKLKPVEDVLIDFEMNLRHFRMLDGEYTAYLQKGNDELTAYLDAKQASFSKTQQVELNLSGQQSMVGEARLGGILDLVDIDRAAKTMHVYDYKTGRPETSWKGTNAVGLYKYRQQLLFYKLLIENSRDYSSFTVTEGTLDYIKPTPSGAISSLSLEFDPVEVERFKKLVESVWRHIIALDLPDTSGYSQDLKGILAFEQDLIDNKV
jgi:DNA helicase-2/ATP-dependent DNA helicase PcrA